MTDLVTPVRPSVGRPLLWLTLWFVFWLTAFAVWTLAVTQPA